MNEQGDVIIVGAGLGGLAAAGKLLKSGMGVLVVDKNRMPGGTANYFEKGPFTFPMGPLGFANPEIVSRVLAEIGVQAPPVKRIDYRLLAFGQDLILSRPPASIERELAERNPDDCEGINSFFRLIEERVSSYQSWIDEEARRPLRWSSINARDYLDRLIRDQGLRHVLGSLGSNPPFSDLDLLCAMWIIMAVKGIYYPEGGSRRISKMLGQAVESNRRGRLLLGRRVREINVSAGKVRGVTLDDGTELKAHVVISNADFKKTFLDLIPRQELPPKLFRDVSLAPQTMSKVQVCLGLRRSSLDLSVFEDVSRVIYRRNGDFDFEAPGIDWRKAEIDPELFACQELEISLLSKDDRLTAPGDGETMIVRAAANYDHFAKFRTSRGRTPGYIEYKTRLAEALVSEAEKLIPGLKESILLTDIATPITFEEFGSRSEGAVAGWSWNYPANETGARSLLLTPISGLYMAGYQAFSRITLGGVPSAMLSGIEAAESALQGAGPVEEIPIPLAEVSG
jgi:phytoene dehydrogenase-like protein